MDRFKYGDVEVEIRYVGPGRAPFSGVPTDVYDVTVKGPGARITLPDWIPTKRKLYRKGVPGLAQSAIMTMEYAAEDPEGFRARKTAEGFSEEMIERVVEVARTLKRSIFVARNLVSDEFLRMEEREAKGKRHGQDKGPREWFPERR